jgi:hypothetical protein
MAGADDVKRTALVLSIAAGTLMPAVWAAGPTTGAAPKGDATAVATRIIKYNFPECRRVTSATRSASDGSIRATCDGKAYLVFTVFEPKAGKLHELAMNCTAAKQVLNISC